MNRKMQSINFKIEKYLVPALFAVLLVAFLMRAYHLTELFPFTMDEEYQAFLADKIIKTGHIPLIGVNVADTGLYLGPLFTWFSAFLYWIGSGSPIMTAWASVGIGVLSCWLMIKVIHLLTKDYWLGLIGGLLYAVNPLVVMYDRKFWNPSFVILLTLFWLYSIEKARENPRWWWGVALVFGLAFHIHYSLFILLIPTIVLIFKDWKNLNRHKSAGGALKQKKFVVNTIIRFGIIKIMFLAPLVLFELRHGFVQLRGLLDYLVREGEKWHSVGQKLYIGYSSLNRFLWLGYGKDIAREINLASFQNSHTLFPICLIFVILIVYLLKRKGHTRFLVTFSACLFTYLASLTLFKSNFSEYYFLPLFPMFLVLIMLAAHIIIEQRGVKAEYLLGIFLTFVLTFWTAQSLTLRNTLGIGNKIELMKSIKNMVKTEPYELYVQGKYTYEGYRYLSEWQGAKPVSSYMDGHFGWIYGEGNTGSVNKITIISELDKDYLYNIRFDSQKKAHKVKNFYVIKEERY